MREMTGMSQVDLGTALGIDPGSISRFERNARIPKTATRARIAAFFKLEFDWVTESIVPPADMPEEMLRGTVVAPKEFVEVYERKNEPAPQIFTLPDDPNRSDLDTLRMLIDQLPPDQRKLFLDSLAVDPDRPTLADPIAIEHQAKLEQKGVAGKITPKKNAARPRSSRNQETSE